MIKIQISILNFFYRKKYWLIGVFILLSVVNSIGQNKADREFQLWSDYNLNIQVNSKLSYGGDTGIRGFISNYDWNQFYIRPAILYRFNYTFNVRGGLASFNTFNRNEADTYEFRLFQDLNIRWPDFGWVEMFYRIRLEERFFFNEGESNDSEIRSRYLVGMETIDYKLFSKTKSFYNKVSWEGFLPVIKENTSDFLINNARLSAIIGHRISDSFRYELHYVWQRSRISTDNGLTTTQNVFRIRFYHSIIK